jgi:hypothetical protein
MPLAVYERHARTRGVGMVGSEWVGRGNPAMATLSQVRGSTYRMFECRAQGRPVSIPSGLLSTLSFGT